MLSLSFKRENIRLASLLATFFILHYGFAKLPIPGSMVLQAAWFVLYVGYFSLRYAPGLIRQIIQIPYLKYILVLMMFAPFYALIAQWELSQRYISGFVGGRLFLFLFPILVMIYYLRTGKVKAEALMEGLKNLAWFSISLYIFMIFFVDLRSADIATYGDVGPRDARARFDVTFMTFGLMYHFVHAASGKKVGVNLLCCLPFLAFIVIYLQSRAVVIAVAAALLTVSFLFFDLMSKIRFIYAGIIAVILAVIYFVLINPEHVWVNLIKNLISLLLYGYSDEYSTNARAREIVIANASIAVRPWFGVGMLNASVGNFAEMFGRVNTVDIGIIGSVMKFGYIGTVLIYGQFIPLLWFLLVYNIKKIKKELRAPIQILLLMCMYVFFMSLFTGSVSSTPLSAMIYMSLFLVVYMPQCVKKANRTVHFSKIVFHGRQA